MYVAFFLGVQPINAFCPGIHSQRQTPKSNHYSAIRRVANEKLSRYCVGKSSCLKNLFRPLSCFQKVFNLLMLVCKEHARMIISPNQHANFL